MNSLFLIVLLSILSLSYGYLIVVGEVGYTDARILYERYHPDDSETVDVKVYKCNGPDVQEVVDLHQQLTAEKRPKILKLFGLEENTKYKVTFNGAEADFHTFSPETDSLKVIAVSCDHTITDDDDETWIHMINNDDWDVMAHLGDQIYADKLYYMENNKEKDWTYEEILEGFRDIYRYTFGSDTKQVIYRHNSHLMVPDDHEIRDNIFWENIEGVSDVFMSAGRQAMYEYQTALHRDVKEYNETGPVYFNKIIGKISLSMLDTRFARTFADEPDYKLLGAEQTQYWLKEFESMKNDDNIESILVFTSVPLMIFDGFFAYLCGDLYHNDKYPPHSLYINNTLQILNPLFEMRDKVKGLIAGDAHIYLHSDLCNSKHECIPQFVSSGMSNASTVLPRFLPFYFYTFSILFSQYPYYNYYNYPNDMFAYKNYITFNVSKELTFAPYKDKNQLGLHLTLRQMMYPILSYAPVVVLFLAIVIMIKLLREFRTEINQQERKEKEE